MLGDIGAVGKGLIKFSPPGLIMDISVDTCVLISFHACAKSSALTSILSPTVLNNDWSIVPGNISNIWVAAISILALSIFEECTPPLISDSAIDLSIVIEVAANGSPVNIIASSKAEP